MIELTRINGGRFSLNAELIERVDETPDTVITLVEGAKYVVTESVGEVIELVRLYRATVIAMAQEIRADPDIRAVHLRLLHGEGAPVDGTDDPGPPAGCSGRSGSGDGSEEPAT